MTGEWQLIAGFGRRIVAAGLTSSRFGNISLRHGEKIFITATGSSLDELDRDLVVETDLTGPCPSMASSETCVHRAIYRESEAEAIIHTHSPFAVVLSLIEREAVEPIDSEGVHFLGAMPIVDGPFGTEELGRSVSLALRDHPACIARGHGVFAAGKSLPEAYIAVCMAEHSSQVRYLVRSYLRGRKP